MKEVNVFEFSSRNKTNKSCYYGFDKMPGSNLETEFDEILDSSLYIEKYLIRI